MTKYSKLSKWKIDSSRIVHKTDWIEIIEDACVSGGINFTYTYTRRVDAGPLIIAQENNGSMWLVRQYRHPVQKILWQFPVEGKLIQESWIAAAKRGLYEELGLTAKDYSMLGEFLIDPGGSDQKYQIFLATNLSPTPHAHISEEIEDLEKCLFTRSEIHQMVVDGEICDNWTLSALYILDKHNLLNK